MELNTTPGCILLGIMSVLPVLGAAYCYFDIKFRSPYLLEFLCGKPGTGKTTELARIVQEKLADGWHVYSNVPIAGAKPFDERTFGVYAFPWHSWIIWDEAGLMLDNRKYAKLPQCVRDLIKYHRHYGISITFASQGWDIDLKVRQCCRRFYLLHNYAGVLTVKRKLGIVQRIVAATASDPASVVEDLNKIPFIGGGVKLLWLPKYWGLYDTFSQPLNLKPLPDEPATPYPDGRKFDRWRKYAPCLGSPCTAGEPEAGSSNGTAISGTA